jgi:SAM-dependent methyltransferase
MAEQHLEYFHYLQGRSKLGWLYRRYYLYPKLISHLPGRVLDVGCGIGDFLRCHPNAVGADVNPHTVEYCREQNMEAYLIEDGRLPFDDGVFDSAILDNVLEHLLEPAGTLDEIRRVLRPGGRFVVGVPGRKGYAGDPDHKRFYDARALVETVEFSGFKSERLLCTPVASAWLDNNLSQYCLYGLFQRR